MRKLNNKNRTTIMIALLAGLLALELVGCLRVSTFSYREVRGIIIGRETERWVWE